MNMVATAYAENILDESVHSRLVKDLERISSMANIPPQMILTSMTNHCSPGEVEWVRHIKNREDDKLGLAYVGAKGKMPVESRMMAMGGALLRNFIDARIFTVQDIISRLDQGNMPDPTVLMIPNFFISKEQGGHISSWHVSSLLGLLITRLSNKRVTCLYVDDLKRLEAEYGKSFVSHLKQYFTLIA